MRLRTLLRLAAVGAMSATLLSAAPVAPGHAVPQGDPPGTTYVYRGTFTAEVSHSLLVDWADNDNDDRAVSATIAGTLPSVKMDDLDLFSLSPASNTVRVVSAVGSGFTHTNSGRHERVCKATTATVSGKPTLLPDRARGANAFVPFSLLTMPGKCTDSDGVSSTITYHYGPLVTDLWDGRAGDDKLELRFHAARGLPPLQGPDTCPGYIPGQTEVCSYEIDGVLTLHLVKKVPPTPKPSPQPSKATLAPGAKKVSAPVGCPARCTVKVRVTPLKGGPTLAVRRVTPAVGRVVPVKVSIPAAKRRLVKKAGGVRVTLTYRLAGGASYTETRKARL